MSSVPGQLKLIKSGLLQLDEVTGRLLRVIVFQYNPETLTRTMEILAAPPPAPPPPGREVIAFTLTFDAADKLEAGDELAQQEGILPALAAMQVLLNSGPMTLTVWVSGNKRVVPVHITGMQFVEQAFDPKLNPTRAEVAITLTVMTDQELANDPRGRSLLDAYFLTLQQLAQLEYTNGSLAALALSGI
jgi:hypothetical protein